MKKSLLILIGLTMLVSQSFAQLTLDHTFSDEVHCSYPIIDEPIGLYYMALDNTFYLYNSNYSLYKTVVIDFPSGYKISSVMPLGKHLINTDDKIEFFIIAYYQSSSYWTKIVNEDGVVMQDLGQLGVMPLCSGVYKVGTQLRLNIYKGAMNLSYVVHYQTEVYICHGNYNAVASFENENTTMRPYPNPTTALINLPYHIDKGTVSTINIYNINGQLVDSYNIDGDFEMIVIDVSNYAKGIYVYEYNGISNRFVVQ